MEPVAEMNELMERIRRAADRENGASAASPGVGGAGSDLPPLSETLPRFMVSALTVDILDQAKQMLPSARRKNEVSKTVPKLLRPLYRNQGGFNGVLLEVIERLITANRQLAEQMGQFRDWAEAVGQDSLQNRAWATATDLRLEAFRDERLVEIEVRLNRLEQSPGTIEHPPKGSTATSALAAVHAGDQPPLETRLAEISARTGRLEAEHESHAELANQLRAQQARLAQLEAQLARLQTPAA